MSSTRRNSSSRDHRAQRDPLRFAVRDQVIRLDPSAGHSSFEVVDDPVRAYQETPTADRITGFGEQYDSCGNPMAHFCADCGLPARDRDGDLVEVGQTCWRQECPRCGAAWAMRRAYPITSKIESCRSEIQNERGDSPLFHHVVVNLDDFRVRGDADDAYFRVAKAAIDEVGVNVFGGALIHHSHSGEGEDEDDLDKWKQRLFNGRSWEDVEKELEVDHHIHAIVLADSIDYLSCEHLYDRTGLLIHRVENNDEDSNVSLFGVEDLADATTYSLSHARESDDADAYRYFGRIANHTADHRIEARCKEVVRSVVPKTLDLTPADLSCDRGLSSDQYDKPPNLSKYNYEDSKDSDIDEDQQEIEDTETETESDEQSGPDETSDSADGSDGQTGDPDESGSQDDEQPDATDDNSSQNSTDASDQNGDSTNNSTQPTVHCNGRLVPMRFAPSWLDDDDRELEYADELQRVYQEWDPPPEDADITAYTDN